MLCRPALCRPHDRITRRGIISGMLKPLERRLPALVAMRALFLWMPIRRTTLRVLLQDLKSGIF